VNINTAMPEEMRKAVSEFNDQMRNILDQYGVPDPKIVGKLPKGGIQLDYVSHAEITRILIQVDPLWEWEPVAWDENGLPAISVVNGMAQMAGRLTIHGVTRIGIGSAPHNKGDLYKELVSDFLRNAAMRFGIALSLWSKQEWEENTNPSAPVSRPAPAPNSPAPTRSKPAQSKPVAKDDTPTKLSGAQIRQFAEACAKAKVEVAEVTERAGVSLDDATSADLPRLREAFKAITQAASGE